MDLSDLGANRSYFSRAFQKYSTIHNTLQALGVNPILVGSFANTCHEEPPNAPPMPSPPTLATTPPSPSPTPPPSHTPTSMSKPYIQGPYPFLVCGQPWKANGWQGVQQVLEGVVHHCTIVL